MLWSNAEIFTHPAHKICKIFTSLSDHFFRTLNEAKYPDRVVSKRKYSAAEVKKFLGD